MLDWMQGWQAPDTTAAKKLSTHCKSHWRAPVKIGEYQVLASGSRHESSTRKKMGPDAYLAKPTPSFGFYLDGGWLWKLTGIAGIGIGLTNESSYYDWPFMVIKWPDMGTLEDDDMTNILSYLKGKLEAKESIEIGCIGGHGRTGTLLAMLRVYIGGMGAKESIESIRKDYCDHAVESKKQVEAIYKVAGEKYDENTAPDGAKIWYGGFSYSPSIDCDSCGHTDWSHERVASLFADNPEVKSGERGCAFKKFNDGDEWGCPCKGFVDPPKKAMKGPIKYAASSRQAQFSELAASQDGSNALDNATEQDLEAFQKEIASVGKDAGDYLMPTQEELDDETKLWDFLCRDYGGDLCSCYHMRADHPAKNSKCNLCGCVRWELGWHQENDGEWTNDTADIERSHS